MMLETASGGPCAGGDTRRSGLDLKQREVAPPSVLNMPAWQTPPAAQAPSETVFDIGTYGSKGAAHYGYLFTWNC